ncbi:hypothetical protein FHS29_003902 [Saccharothrix tamanrassetensis]|uniref:Uncharacterized protein n=1 Tax=Saccharothrix tamanrassetensis TaxID=1051531 RepID=A0A841CJ28_9PSEU|nr:hypothetical protein [Saccharothrix tamanrassetensis]MBB5957309.1 hypothetical protein [Saccharothrix tamanrassetensis]
MEHEFYRGGALRDEVRTRARVKAVLGTDVPRRWNRTTIDLRHQLKAGACTVWCMRVLARAGVKRHVLDALAPVLFHIEALVYVGDFEYENAQTEGTAVDPRWREGIEEILRAYQLDDRGIVSALARLVDYLELETDILAGRTPLHPDLIPRTCYIRCSGINMLVRIGFRLAGIQPDEEFFALLGQLSAHDEISTDLASYEEDLEDGAFNVYRLANWIYGPQAAEHHLRRHGDDMLRALRRDIANADRKTLTLFAAALPPIVPFSPQLPSIVPKLLPRAPLARLVDLRLHYHSTSKPLRFPEPVPDTAPAASRQVRATDAALSGRSR